MVWTTVELALAAQARREARAGLAVLMVMWFFSFSENLEMLAYLYWSGLIVIGLGLRAAVEASEAGRKVARKKDGEGVEKEEEVRLLPAPGSA